jgi:hypothetical protein
MIKTSQTDFSNPTDTCEAVIPIRQRVILNLVWVDLELFNATACGSQKRFSHELFDHILFLEALCLPEDREVHDFDSVRICTYQA